MKRWISLLLALGASSVHAAAPGSTYLQFIDNMGQSHSVSGTQGLPIQGSVSIGGSVMVTANNASVGVNGAAQPGSSTQMGLQNGANMSPARQGQQAMANSLAVAIASDQSALPINPAGTTFTVNQGTNPWTSNGTVFQANGANLHVNVDAAPAVTGTVAISGITGTVSLTPNTNGSVVLENVTIAESSVAVPPNTTQVLIENESNSLNGIRWGISNSAASILSYTIGVYMEPGRDSGVIQAGYGSYVHYLTLNGTAFLDIQFVKSQ